MSGVSEMGGIRVMGEGGIRGCSRGERLGN